MKSIVCILLAALVSVAAFGADAPGKQPLKVLYVGGSGDWAGENPTGSDGKPEDVAKRMASFEEMLKRYFTDVTVMHAKDYRQEDSMQFDVTVMDGTPKPIEPRRDLKDANGRITQVIAARYFTEDFVKPVLMIGEAGERLGRRVGSKFDWYCLCLDAHALEIRKQHAIFQGPFKVKMTMEDRPTPEHAKEYEMMMGRKVPETVPMWRVQTKGYMTDRGFRVGMVARPWGFEDSPDAEIISGGVCAKGLDAVALGRHGNFFGWGFAASPGYMTDEANTVLANAICYIAKFDGQGVITRKYDDRVANKDDLKIQKYAASAAAYEHNLKGNRQHTEMMQRTAKEAAAKKEKGEKISRFEEIAIGYKPAPEQTREQWMRSRFRDLYARFGNDEKAYHRYYDENYDYFYPGDGRASGGLKVDEDAKALGIANTDHRILAKCISDWERGENVERARRVLERYTMLDFASAREWRSWYDQNKSRLFFTQSGGWVFMVNTRDPKVEGNDYAREQSTTVYRGVQTATTDDLNPVSIASGVVDVGNGKKELVTKFKIHPGYHIYAMVAPNDAFTQTKVSVELPAGFSKVGDLQMPGFSPKGENTGIFTDEIAFKQEISGNGQGEAIVKIEYQCCDARICFPPVEREIRVRL